MIFLFYELMMNHSDASGIVIFAKHIDNAEYFLIFPPLLPHL